MGYALALEDFDSAAPGFDGDASNADAVPSEDWRAGHAAGRAEAEGAGAATQETLSAALVDRLADMAFGYAEARAALMEDLKPLFQVLGERLLPDLGSDLLAAHLAQALFSAAEEDLSQPLVLRVSVSDVVAVSDLLGAITTLPFTCRADPNLPPGTALIGGATSGGVRESSLDIAQLTDGLRAILSAVTIDQPQDAAHG